MLFRELHDSFVPVLYSAKHCFGNLFFFKVNNVPNDGQNASLADVCNIV